MALSYAARPAKKPPKPGSKFAAPTPKSTGCSMEDLSGARAQSCRRSWILRKPADTTSQHSTTTATTAESASAYNSDVRPYSWPLTFVFFPRLKRVDRARTDKFQFPRSKSLKDL